MQQGTRKRAHQEGSVQPKAGNSSSLWSILKEIRMLRFGFPAASEQSAAESRNSAAAGLQKRQRGWKGSFSQLRFSSVCLELWASFQPYCYSPPEEQHHRRARRRDEALMLCSKLSDLAENQGKERSAKRWSLHGHEKLRASSSAQQDAAEFLPAGRCGWQHISSSARNWDARADWDRIPPRGPLRDQFCSAQHPRGTGTTSILSRDHNAQAKHSKLRISPGTQGCCVSTTRGSTASDLQSHRWAQGQEPAWRTAQRPLQCSIFPFRAKYKQTAENPQALHTFFLFH